MDPIANIEKQRNIADRIVNEVAFEDDAFNLAELVLALDEWRRKGGFDPYQYGGGRIER